MAELIAFAFHWLMKCCAQDSIAPSPKNRRRFGFTSTPSSPVIGINDQDQDTPKQPIAAQTAAPVVAEQKSGRRLKTAKEYYDSDSSDLYTKGNEDEADNEDNEDLL